MATQLRVAVTLSKELPLRPVSCLASRPWIQSLPLLAMAFVLALASCSTPLAEVRQQPARYQRSGAATGGEARISEQRIGAAEGLGSRDPAAAMGAYLSAADAALYQLRRRPADAGAMRDYNFALARVFSTICDGKVDAWSQPLSVPPLCRHASQRYARELESGG